MLRYQKYSWQVAPLQSPLPLPSGGSKVYKQRAKNEYPGGIITEIRKRKKSINDKEKKNQKKKEEKEWAIAHELFMLGFTRHKYPSMDNSKSITFATC